MSRLLNESEARQFEKLLADYTLHESVLELFLTSKFAVIAGPTGAGKDTLRNDLIAKYPSEYLPILSTTTRPMRSGEVEGETYHFRSISEVHESLMKREFFQAQLVHNQQISCLHADEIRKLRPNQWGLSILITATESQMRRIKPDIRTVFVVAPDFDTLIKRIHKDRRLEEPEITRRLVAAAKELQDALEQKEYFCIISDTIENATRPTHEFLQNNVIDKNLDTNARMVIKQILDTINVRIKE